MDMGGGALLHPPETLRGHEQHRHEPDHAHDHEDDLGPETSVDDGELQRQQLADLDPAAEPRQDAPTPPAASLLPGQLEADNVADSGEDSEDEWNYFKVEPTGKAVDVQSLVQAKQSVCPETTQLNLKAQLDDSIDMESRLNPDAAEFVPSPTHSKPSFEDTIISQSPTGKIMPSPTHSKPSFEDAIISQSPTGRIMPLDVEVPSMAEFQQEISQRPGEISCDDALSNSGLFSPLQKDLLNGVNITVETVSKHCDDLEMKLTEQNLAVFTSNNPFEVSEISSTKAEYGDESATSFAASDILPKNLGSNTSNADSSITETDFVLSETSSGKLSQEPFGFETPGEFSDFRKGLDSTLHSNFTPIKDMGTISFEVQKEIAPTMEECPERVKLTDDLINPFSHEEPIAESPAEENEQRPEPEKVSELNESFEHSPNFTLDAFEVTSPLNPCAPSFDYQVLEDAGEERESEMSKVVPDAGDQTFTHSLETVTGSSSSVIENFSAVTDNFPMQSAGEMSPNLVGRVDAMEPPKNSEPDSFEPVEMKGNDLLQETSKSGPNDITASDEKLEAVSNLVEGTFDKTDFMGQHENSSEFAQPLHVDNLSQSENELNEPQQIREEQRTLGEFHRDSEEIEQKVTDEYNEQELLREAIELNGDSKKEEVNAPVEPSTETNEYTIQNKVYDLTEVPHDKSVDLIEDFNKFSEDAEKIGEADMLEMDSNKEKAEFSGKFYKEGVEHEINTVQQMDFQTESADFENHFSEPPTDNASVEVINEELLKESTETLEELHKMPVGLTEGSHKSEESAVEKLQQDSNAILENTIPENLFGSESKESNEEVKPEESETVSHLPDEKIPPSPTVAASKLVSDLDVNGSLLADEVCVLGKDKISQVYSEENEIKDIPEKMSPELTDKAAWPTELCDIPEQLRVCVYPLPVKQNETDVELIPPSLMDNEVMEETRKEILEHNDYDASLKVEILSGEQRDMLETLVDQVGNKLELTEGEVETNIAANEEDIRDDTNEKTEHITEKVIERKDNLNLETLDKLDIVTEVSDHTQLKTCEEASCEVKEVSESTPQDDEPNKEVQEGVMQKDIRTPPPTPASQAELSLDRDLPELKSITGPSVPEPAAAAAALAAAAAGIVGTAVASSVKKESTTKKMTTATTKDLKKTPTVKEPEKLKSTKTSSKPSPSTAKVTSKTSPTSPTKLSVASTPRTSTPKKTPTPPSTAVAKASAKVPLATTKPSRPSPTTTKSVSVHPSQKSQLSVAGKVSPATTVSKTNLKTASAMTKPTATTTVRSASAPKPRIPSTTTTAAGVKTTLTNGDIKPADAKKSSTTTTKVAPRSHTAPARTTATKTVTGTTAGSVAKSGIQARTGVTSRTSITNGIASKPRVTSSTAPSTRTTANLPTATDKQHKETANKHISARRVGTVPSKTGPAKVGVKKSSPTTKGAKAVPPANGDSPLISAGGEVDKKKTDPLL